MTISLLLEGLQRGDFSVGVVLDRDVLEVEGLRPPPDSVMHFFACDCVERAMMREEAPPRVALESLEKKRRWIFGGLSDEALGEVMLEVRKTLVAQTEFVGLVGPVSEESLLRVLGNAESSYELMRETQRRGMLVRLALRALRGDAFHASLGAVNGTVDILDKELRVRERVWQRERLGWLLGLYLFAGERWGAIAPGGETPHSCPEQARLEYGIGS